jgi:hypothetical protein
MRVSNEEVMKILATVSFCSSAIYQLRWLSGRPRGKGPFSMSNQLHMLLYTDRSIYGFPETLKDLEDGIFDVR